MFSRAFLNKVYIAVLSLSILAIYAYPYAATWSSLGKSSVPPSFFADLYLYMNLSNLQETGDAGDKKVINPWYKTEVPSGQLVHLKFGATYRMFSVFRKLLGGHWGVTLLVWNLLWMFLIITSACFFFRAVCGPQSTILLCLGLSLLLLFNFPYLKQTILAISSIWAGNSSFSLELPYIRSFFPQAVIPFILLYLGVQLYALRTDKVRYWLGMLIIQFIAFFIFPFAVPLMLGATCLACIGLYGRRGLFRRLMKCAGYLFWTGVIYFVFFQGSMPSHGIAGGEGMGNPIAFDVSRFEKIFHGIGVYWTFMVLLAVMVALMREEESPEVKWTVVGAGFANSIFLFSDVAFSPVWLISAHMEYFMHFSTTLLAVYAISKAFKRSSALYGVSKLAVIVIILITVAQGIYAADQTYRRHLASNEAQATLESFFERESLNSHDLIICEPFAPAGWIPLLHESQVLFSQQAYHILTRGQRENIQRSREALYLYLTGMDIESLEQRLSDYHRITEFPYLLASENKAFLWYDLKESKEIVSKIVTDLRPFFKKVKERDKEVEGFFRQFKRIFVVESVGKPVFQREKLGVYMSVEESRSLQGFSIRIAKPLNLQSNVRHTPLRG